MTRNKIGCLIYDSYKNNVPTQFANMTKTERENGIRKMIYETLGLDAEQMIENFNRKAYRQAMREKKSKVFAIIEDVADQVLADGEYKRDVFYNRFVEDKNLALGDKNEFYVDVNNDMELVEFSGNHWDIKRKRVDVGQSFSIAVNSYGIKMFEEFERIMSGRADFARLIEIAIEAVQKTINRIARETFQGAVGNLPSEFTFSGSYNEADILKVLEHVEASNDVKPIIVGTSSALGKLQNTALVSASNNMKDEYNSQGYLTMWKGYECVKLDQGHKTGGFEFTFDDGALYVLAGDDKLVKVVLEGETEIEEVSDGTTNADRTTTYMLQLKMGAGVVLSNMIGYISLT